MAEHDAFELRLGRALTRYVADLAVGIDAVELTESIAAAHESGGRLGALRLSVPGLAAPLRLRHLAWIILLAGLLAVTAIGLALVGTGPRRVPLTWEPLPTQRGLVATDIEVLQPNGWSYEQTLVDGAGMIWTAGGGHVIRLNPVTGKVRAWTIHDDAAFGSSTLGAPARTGGVWLIDANTLRLLDGDGFRQVISAPFAIRGLAEAPDSALWATSEDDRGGVYRWDGSGWTGVPALGTGLMALTVAVDRDGAAWVAAWSNADQAPAGLWRFDGSTWTVLEPDTATAPSSEIRPLAGSITAIAPAPDGSIWITAELPAIVSEQPAGTASSERPGTEPPGYLLLRLDGTRWTVFGRDVLGFDPISVSVGPDGAVWTAGERAGLEGIGVAQFDSRGWHRWGTADGLPVSERHPVFPTVAASRAAVLVGTTSGLYRLTGERWERAWPVNREGPAQASSIVALTRDDAWAGDLVSPGLWRFRDGRWTNARAGLLAEGPVVDIARAPDGRLWAATDGGLAVLDGDLWTMVGEGYISALAVGPDGTVLTSGAFQIRRVRPDGDGWSMESLPAWVPAGWIVGSLAVDADGVAWAAPAWVSEEVDTAHLDGLARLDGDSWQTVRPPGWSEGSFVPSRLRFAPDGALWLLVAGFQRTVVRFDGANWTAYGPADGVADPSWLEIAPDGSAWVLGSNGLTRFDGRRWSIVRRLPDLPPPSRFAVAADGTVWVAGPAIVGRIATEAP